MKLHLLTLRVRDLSASHRFYSLLGLPFVQHEHGGPRHWCAEGEFGVFELYPCGDDQTPTQGLRVGFDVEDAGTAVRRLVAAGAHCSRPLEPTSFGLRAVVRDPDGNAVEIRQEATR
jgi:lactoylglutathione lyase